MTTGSLPPEAAAFLDSVPRANYVCGEWRSSAVARDLEDPGTGQIFATAAVADSDVVRAAIEGATTAQRGWAATSPHDRARIIQRIADGIRRDIDRLAHVLTIESGKTLAEARSEWLAAAALFEWYAEEGKRAYGRVVPAARADRRILVLAQPIGVIGTITAWNFPAYLPARKWAAALAAGCAVVGRPSDSTPLSALLIAEQAEQAGLPPGVLNVVSGPAATVADALLDSPDVRKISFTGSATAGRYLLNGASRTFTKLSLELGGSAPVLVFEDADIQRAVELSVQAKFRNAGQVCISPSRFLVHRTIADAFTEALVERTRSLIVGHGLDPATEVGPVRDARALAKIDAFVRDAVAGGAVLLTGGAVIDRPGYYYEPTVVSGVHRPMKLSCEEVFGPVIAVTSFDSEAEAVYEANATDGGLAAYIHTADLSRAFRVSEQLEFGIVGINDMLPATAEAPFGGWKASGNASEGGIEGLREFMQTKYVDVAI
jgi:succinate-semialdehyde dehydrogenase/glutarate-semialdehyde dehydrogenase